MVQELSNNPNSSNSNNISDPELNSDGRNPYDQQTTFTAPLLSVTNNQPNDNVDINDQTFFKKMRGSLMIVAILAAGSTYQAGLNPPGSFWQEGTTKNHKAGTPILHDMFFDRYQVFFYCNAVSFLSSLVIIIFLMNTKFYCNKVNIKGLKIAMVLDLLTFTLAYSVGSCRLVSTSFYVFAIMVGVILVVFLITSYYSHLCNFVNAIFKKLKKFTILIWHGIRPTEAAHTESTEVAHTRPTEAAQTISTEMPQMKATEAVKADDIV